MRCHVGIGDMLPELASKLCLNFLQLQRLEGGTRTSVNLGLVSDDVGAEGFRESADRLAEITLEELDHRRGEV